LKPFRRYRRRLILALALTLLAVPSVVADKKDVVLGPEHPHPLGAFTYRLPQGWTVQTATNDPDALDASGDGAFVRLFYRRGEVGYDGLHGICLMQRFPGHAEGEPQYEYDYVEGVDGPRRILDSAFVLDYPVPVRGYKKWRQRNLTVVGGGHSLCVIAFAPVPVWKKSGKARSATEALIRSVKFKE
jgi:hypothetical protein